MKIFVTGHCGYIGAHLIRLIAQEGWQSAGCDLRLYPECEWASVPQPDRFLQKDIRALNAADLAGYDCIMHLAALSNDPMGDINHALTLQINRDASLALARLGKAAGVRRFIFASSCSLYGGGGGDAALDETAQMRPLSAYARSKVETEELLRPLADDNFSPVFLRNATAFGSSPAFRADLVANNLLAAALAHGEIRIKSDGEPWRPLVHCYDIAAAMVAAAKAPQGAIHNRAINVGANGENFQVKDIAAAVAKLTPTAKVVFTGETGEDPRNYRVNFDLLAKLLPDFAPKYTLASGLQELHAHMTERGFSAADFDGARFARLRLLQQKMHLLSPAAPADP